MNSNYFGDQNLGNERSSSSSSSRKGKKSENKQPKQPQRGLGVAQLEKIRLHTQMASTYSNLPNYPTQEDVRLQTAYPSSSLSSYGYGHQNIMMGLGELERSNIGYGDSLPSTTPRWNVGNGMLETQQFPQPNMARHYFNPQAEDSLQKKRRKDQNDSVNLGSRNSETSDTQELDLELRL
ncbi:hypothetical protein CEY00_Acc13071 [Actinidia chinensis var. chinensis]|uniref:Uncharacterized protein n=1 Tax=Actinidia chinensis var. chinensis TaxID=1590841 RepID=A0A2R6QV15_ACTCC|nr:hypothetical protein CEY00_Acc13071 [Actinidia chinensis var. chinensis]